MGATTNSPADLVLERELMQKVKTACGPWIAEGVEGSFFPASLFAAITANESGGDPTKTRQEPEVFLDLVEVYLGRQAEFYREHFGSIGGADIQSWFPPGGPISTPQSVVLQILHWATSWGPTQVMGYEALANHYKLEDLVRLETHYARAVQKMKSFRARWQLEISAENYEKFFRCWNTGRPDGVTADPRYVENGLLRLQLYEGLS